MRAKAAWRFASRRTPDAGANSESLRATRSVLECASPLALSREAVLCVAWGAIVEVESADGCIVRVSHAKVRRLQSICAREFDAIRSQRSTFCFENHFAACGREDHAGGDLC